MAETSIEWCTTVWNPVTGCTKVSQGCKHCYAERMAKRFWKDRTFTDVRVHPERLDDPKHWRKPRRVFVNSMSDLFHSDVPDAFIWNVLGIAMRASKHQFYILTKRPERLTGFFYGYWSHPPANIWLGVSVEDQKTADKRIPNLMIAPVAHRFISAEPLLGPVDLTRYLIGGGHYDKKVEWVIVGGESGPGARPVHPEWVRSLRDQCQIWNTKFFFKQWGEYAPVSQVVDVQETYTGPGVVFMDRDGNTVSDYCNRGGALPKSASTELIYRFGKKRAGRLLDGREWAEMPDSGAGG